MKKVFTLIILFFTLSLGISQGVDFESFGLEPGTFDNDSSPEPFFESDNFRFPNDYNAEFDFWSGWAISADTDTQTPGFMNQYSSIAGTGADDSQTYAVSFASPSSVIILEEEGLRAIDSIQVNNSTYTYLSMRDGDSFAKKFGGETGDDPDFFLLTIKSYGAGALIDSISFYLADYRFEDNSQDYIVDEWTTIAFSDSEAQDSLVFSLSSSDNGMFGMNTPAYFCVDNIKTNNILSTADNTLSGISLVNTLADEMLLVNNDLSDNLAYQVVNIGGQPVISGQLTTGENQIDLGSLPTGKYWINVREEGLQWTEGFVKR